MSTMKKASSAIPLKSGFANTRDHKKYSSRDVAVEKLTQMVFSEEEPPDCLFFKVPESIRRVRSECYQPQVVALGLHGRSNKQCCMMEDVKLELAGAVLKVLLNSTELAKTKVHSGVSEVEKVTVMWNHLCENIVRPGEELQAKQQYSDASQDLTNRDVQHYLALDATFLVSFMLFQHADPKTKSIGIVGFEKYKIILQIFTRAEIFCNIFAMNSDIWLFENQIRLLLIRRLVRLMYLDEGDKETSERKKAAADHGQAFGILIKKTFQKALRVLPGNYRTRSRSKPESVTDRMLKSRDFKRSKHLLECLYKLVCARDDEVNVEDGGNKPDDLDSLNNFSTEDENARVQLTRWRANMARATSRSCSTFSTEEIQMQQEGQKSSETGTSRRMDPQGSRIQSTRELSRGGSGRVTDGELTPKSSDYSRRSTSPRENHENEFGSDNEPENVQDHVVPLYSPPSKGIEHAAEQSEHSSASQRDQDQQGVLMKGRASRLSSKSFPKTEHQSEQKSTAAVSKDIQHASSQASEREQLQPRFCCLRSSRVTRMCCGDRETAIHIDSYILPTVTVLRQVGIRVKSDTSPGCHCKVELKYSYLPWGNATLHISPLHMDVTAETLLRNMLVHEKVSPDKNKLITYLQRLDDLIDTERDVSQLKQGRHPVILNNSADEKDVGTSFNHLLVGSNLYYNEELESIRRKVRSYKLQQWRHLLTEFKERYWNHKKPWLAISFVAAFLLLVLTFVQTLYTVLGFYRKS